MSRIFNAAQSCAFPLALALGAALAISTPAQAQSAAADGTDSNAGRFAVRLALSGIEPLDTSSHIDGIGGDVHVTGSVMPEVDLSYFLTDSLSLQLIATSMRHEVSAQNTSLTPLLGNKIDLGSTYVLPPALVLQYHFMPHATFSPYVGAGLDVAWFYNIHENQAQIGGAPLIEKLSLSTMVGPVLNIGADYHVGGNWYANIDIKQVFAQTTARIHTAVGLVEARDRLDPLVMSAGISYRF